MKLMSWVRALGLATLLCALVGLGLSFMTGAAQAQSLAVGLVVFANRIALVVVALGMAALWRRWAWVVALALAGVLTLLSGPLSDALNSNMPYIAGPAIVGALGLAAGGLKGLRNLSRATRAAPSDAPTR